MPVYKLAEMPYTEFLSWFAYFERRPDGWREDLRASYLLQALGVKKSPQEIFPSIKSLNSSGSEHVDSLRQSSFFSKLKSAVGGDQLEFL